MIAVLLLFVVITIIAIAIYLSLQPFTDGEDVDAVPTNDCSLRPEFDGSDSDEGETDAALINNLANPDPLATDPRAGRRLARRIGETVRMQLGCPRFRRPTV